MEQDLATSDPDWAGLLHAARNGEGDALGEVCERLREYLLLAADRGLGNGVRAKVGASDVVQQTYLEVQSGITRFTGSSEEEFRAWLLMLVRHNLIDVARQYRQTQSRDTSRELSIDAGEKQRPIVGPQKTPSSLIRRREIDEELWRAVAMLPERRRQLLELRHRQGLSFAKIGKALGMTEVAARKLWSRTLETLRSTLSTDHDHRPLRPR